MPVTADAIREKLIGHRKLVITVAILLVVIFLISFVPTYAVRHLVSSTLDDFGIEYEGIKTIKINLWNREIWVGPVQFHAGDTDPGQLGEIGIKVNVFPVFKKHAMVERVLIRDIDIIVGRTEDNGITLNGIPLDQFAPSSTSPESPPPEKESSPWGTGLGDFEMLDSRLVFVNKNGGTLKVVIESLKLSDFASWHPDDPGTFDLKARANNIELELKGEARPFAEHITVTVDSNTREASLDKVIEYIGPINLERRGGVFNSSMHHEITLFDTGRLEGHSVGKVTLVGADYAKVDQFAFATDKADVDLDLHYTLKETQDLQFGGRMTVDMMNTSGKLSNDDPYAVDSLHATFTELSAVRSADENIQFSVKHGAVLKQLVYSGRVQLSADVFTNVLSILQSISTKKQISTEETGLDKWAGDEVTFPKSDITIEQLNATVSKLEMKSADGTVSLDIKLDNEANGIKVAATDRATNINNVSVKLDTLRLNSGDGKTGLTLSGNHTVTGVSVKGPIGNGGINSVELDQNIELQINRGDIALQGFAKADIEKMSLQAKKTDTLPQATFEVGKVSANVQKASFSTTQQQIKWQVESGATIAGASASYAEGKISSAKIQRLEWRGAKADQDLNLETKSLTISGLQASTTRQFIDGLIGDKPKAAEATRKGKRKKSKKTKTTAAKPQEDKSDTFQLKLDRFELVDGAQLRFLDQKVIPPMLVDLHIKTAEVHGIDSRNANTKAQAKLVATINEFTQFELDADADNVGAKANMVLKSSLKNLELPSYTSYAAEFAGLNFGSGQFNADIDVKANQGVLDGALKLLINDLEFTPLSEAQAKSLSKTVGVPIETAVKLLKDPKGNIKLALPVSGTVVEPSVNISSAVSKAIGNTLKAVFPPTLIGSMVNSIKEGRQTFKPVLFRPGSSNLDEEAKKYLDEVTALLKERPSLSLDICGRATPDDFEELTLISLKLPPDPKPELVEERQRLIETHGPKLLELATERTRAVRRYLISDKGLNATQVGECQLGFNPDDSEPPRVVVSL